MLVEEFGASRPDEPTSQRGNRVDDELEIALACRDRFLGALAIVDVDKQVVPADNAPVGIPKRKSAGLKPAIDAVETPSADFEFKGIA